MKAPILTFWLPVPDQFAGLSFVVRLGANNKPSDEQMGQSQDRSRMTRRTLRSMMSGKNQPLAQYVFLIWMLGMGIIWSLIGVAEALATYWHTNLPAGLLD